MSLNDISKYIALILRHKPETIGITLDEHGWANVDDPISTTLINNSNVLIIFKLKKIHGACRGFFQYF